MSKVVNLDERRFKKLPPAQYAREIMSLPAKERMAAILDRPDAGAVVQSMPLQDLYVTVMEIGPDDALPLLSMATPEQWTHFFDMECWNKDNILPSQGIEWLERLARAGYQPLVKWLYSVEFFFLIAMIKKWLRVAVKPDDIDLTEARDYLPPNTIDDVYFWECKYPQYEDVIKYVLNVLFETNFSYYREIMEHAMYSLDAEMEEEAYRFHKGRLEDQAIPDYYDAISIYQPLKPSDIRVSKVVTTGEEVKAAPSYAIAHLGKSDLLKQTIEALTDSDLVDYIRLELASVTNKVIVADQVRIDDPQLSSEAIDKVFCTLNLGLHILSGGNLKRAVEIIKSIYIEHIFQVGYDPIYNLGRRARRLVSSGWISLCPVGVDILEAEWYEVLDALLEKFPRFCKLQEGRVSDRKYFQTPSDISYAGTLLDTLACIGGLLGILKIDWDKIENNLWPEGQILSLKDITLSNLLFTAAMNNLVSGRLEWNVEPISVKEWDNVFLKVYPDEVVKHIKSLIDINFPGEHWRRAIYRYIDPLLESYKEEMLSFYKKSEVPDPRWVGFFIFKE